VLGGLIDCTTKKHRNLYVVTLRNGTELRGCDESTLFDTKGEAFSCLASTIEKRIDEHAETLRLVRAQKVRKDDGLYEVPWFF